ncbi:hypothetical protein Leryth_025876 [Lithospermum erythrorhizon]|uniref:TMEM205-like domain-containing protein n=1 Tax=Lithospermum erythrorhizon TaxID=34254 RepID=A0AAV3Q4F7_LITER|nr:hypothetical protein Leryth_025876 [Lithospermum erythrorhizon]
MMNILALSLILTTLLTACVHSPNPQVKDVIVKEGHRVVMVEYDEEGDTNTKVSISPHDQANGQFETSVKGMVSGVVGDAKEILKGASSTVPNFGQGVKDSASDKANQASDLAKDAANDVKSRISSLFSTAFMTKDTVTEKAKLASDMAANAAKNTQSRIEGGAEMAKQRVRGGQEAVKEAIDTTKTMKGDVERNLHKKMDKIRRQGRRLLHSMMRSLRLNMRILQLFGFATAYGMAMWVTFMSNYVLAKALPRQQFASAQSKIYPMYFKAMACSIGLSLVGHLIYGKIRKFASVENFQGLNLLSTLGMILANLYYFEPRTTKVLFERLKLEKEEGSAVTTVATTSKATESPTTATTTEATETTEATTATPTAPPAASESATEAGPLKIIELSETLKRLHSYSSFLNVLTLMGLTLHLVHLGQCLGITC